MSLINKEIVHSKFGKGIILEIYNANIKVQFDDCIKELGLLVAIKMIDADKDVLDEMKKLVDIENNRLDFENQQMHEKFEKEMNEKRLKLKGEKKTKNSIGITNIAFKCNYNDGGFNENGIGFYGICTDKQISINQMNSKAWCTNENCPCHKYFEKVITRDELENGFDNNGFTCYESQALKKFSFSAGCDYNRETGKMIPRHIRLPIGKGSIVFLTTTDNGDKGDKRFVFASYVIDNMEQVGMYHEDAFGCKNKDLRVFLSKEKAKQVLFWEYHKNPNNQENKQWGTGLYRSISNENAKKILNKMKEVDPSISSKIDNMLECIK